MRRIIPYCCAAAALYILSWGFLPPLPSASIFINTMLFFTASAGMRAYPGISLSGTRDSFHSVIPRCLFHAALFAAAVFLTEYALTGSSLWEQIPPGIGKASAIYGSIPVFLVLQLSSAMSEEAFYRFFLLRSLSTRISPMLSAFLVSGIFGLVHYPSSASLMQVCIAFLFSMDMCAMILRSQESDSHLYFRCVLIHFAYNLIIFIIR